MDHPVDRAFRNAERVRAMATARELIKAGYDPHRAARICKLSPDDVPTLLDHHTFRKPTKRRRVI